MLFVVFIAVVFGVLNVLFLFVIAALNELFILSLKTSKWTLFIILMIVALFVIIAISPDIDPVNIDLLTVVCIVVFSTTSLFVLVNLYKMYRSKLGKISFFGDLPSIEVNQSAGLYRRDSVMNGGTIFDFKNY